MMTTVDVGETIPDIPHCIAIVNEEGSLHMFDQPWEVLYELNWDYPSQRPDQVLAYQARVRLAADMINAAQREVNRSVDVQAMSENKRWALSARGKRAVTEIEAWDEQIPLYVSSVFHAPYTDVPLPQGVSVVDPTSEAALVASLCDAGILHAVKVTPNTIWVGKIED